MTDREARTDSAALDKSSLLTLLGRAHTLDLIWALVVDGDPPVRFGEIQDVLDLPPNTLSRRLDELEEAGLVVRHSYDEIPPRVEYEPTEMLYALEPAFRELARWFEEYGADETFEFPDE